MVVPIMNNYKIISLGKSLNHFIVSSVSPFKIIREIDSDTNIYEDFICGDEKGLPNWVEKLDEIGKSGEIIALKYLKTIYSPVKWVADNARLGYDILADDNLFEIKTTISSNTFYISQNEILTAYKNRNRHYIFFIKILYGKPIGYIIPDIFATLELDFELCIQKSNIIENNYITMVSKEYRISFESDYLDSLDPIDLSAYI